MGSKSGPPAPNPTPAPALEGEGGLDSPSPALCTVWGFSGAVEGAVVCIELRTLGSLSTTHEALVSQRT